MSFLHSAWSVMLELAPWLLLGALVAGLLHVLLPRDYVRRVLRGRGGVLKAVLLGVPMPLCSCGVIPAGLGLKRDGASNGAAIGFLVSTPQTGVDSILVSASFLGWPFALFKVGAAFVLGLLGGFVTDRVAPEEAELEGAADAGEGRRSPREGVAHAVEVLRTIWRWLVFGVLVSAAITTLVPPGAFTSLAAYGGVAAMGAMLAVSLPLYVCATASVPIAAALVAGGFPPGAALVFLMAGPATNLATVGAVRRAFGGKVLAVYLLTIGLGSLLLGWAFDFVLVGELGIATHAQHADHAGPVAIASAIVLLATFVWFAIEDARALVRRLGRREPAAEAVELEVDGLTCNGCVRRLEGELAGLPGASNVQVAREPRGVCRVEGVDAAELREAVERAGFRPV